MHCPVSGRVGVEDRPFLEFFPFPSFSSLFFSSLRLDLLTRVEKGFLPFKGENDRGMERCMEKRRREKCRENLPSLDWGTKKKSSFGKSCVEIGGGGKKGNGEGLVRFDRGNFSKRKGNLCDSCRDKSKAKLLNLLIEFFFSNLQSTLVLSILLYYK